MASKFVEIVEVGPRDGFQSVGPFIPTKTKIAIIENLHRAGVRRMEATSFVSPKAAPQLADAAEVLAAAHALSGLDPQVLAPTARHAERAFETGARHIAFVLSVSEAHNQSNVRRSPAESVEEFKNIMMMLPEKIRVRLNIATAFDCPYEGRISQEAVLSLLERLILGATDLEIALCDTTGRAVPDQVTELFAAAMTRFPSVDRWAFHGHDTYGVGVANVMAARSSGVQVIDASIAGLGGCPFAPGATGNVATEDVVWVLHQMGVETGIDLEALLEAGRTIAALPGAQTGGRVRRALEASRQRSTYENEPSSCG